MIIEIRTLGLTVQVRQFGSPIGSTLGSWSDPLQPGDTDKRLTGMTCERLIGLGDGIWQLEPVPVVPVPVPMMTVRVAGRVSASVHV